MLASVSTSRVLSNMFVIENVTIKTFKVKNVCVFESCINKALYKIFGACDCSSLEYLKSSCEA